MKFIVFEKSRELSRVGWADKQMIIGRRADADIRLTEPTSSGIHAKIFAGMDGIRIRDLNSLNGTKVNGHRIVESLLKSGDRIKIGRVTILVSGSPMADPSNDSTEEVTFGQEQRRQSAQTVQISLDELRQDSAIPFQEDHYILLLRNLFETLQSVTDREDVLHKVRDVFDRAFRRARTFILRPTAEGRWHDPEDAAVARRPSLTFAAEAARSNSAILSSSLADDQRFSGSESARISGIQTAIAAPVSYAGKPLAVFYVDRLGLPPFSRRDLNILGIAANHVSAVLENVSHIEDLNSTNKELTEARERLAELNRNLEQVVEKRTAEIRRQAEEIGRLAEAKDELLGIAAHDIRGPLTVIQGTSELLRLKAGRLDPGMLQHSLELMHGSCRSLSQLLSELLDAKAIETGKITLRKRRCTVRSLLEEALPVARLAAEDKQIGLVIETDDHLELDADPQRLGQAITNLVLNAVKFSGSGARIIMRGLSLSPELTRIEIIDQGIGIPEDELEGIFDIYKQGKAGREAGGGSGLGLMIARRLVELHGGTLSAESQVGVGSRFILSLPTGDQGSETVDHQPQA